MIIISKKRFGFVQQDGTERAAATKFVTKGGMAIEDAPDWIKKDPLFELAVEVGEIVEVKNKSAKAEAEAIAKAKKSKAETEDAAK